MTIITSTASKIKARLLRSTTLLSRKAAQWRDDKSGVAAIEFAFIAPAMLVMYFGLLEISMAMTADRAISHAANVAGDLTTQSATISKADMEDILQATLAVMNIKPGNEANAIIEISSFELLADGTRERIGYASLGGPIQKGGAVYNPADIGTRLITINSGAVVARVNYLHKPVTTEYMKNVILNETFMLKPRTSEVVRFEEGASAHNTFMCTAASDLTVSCTSSTT